MRFRPLLLDLGSRVLADFGPEAPTWVPIAVEWDQSGAAPPSDLVDMTWEVDSIYEHGSDALADLRRTDASLVVTFEATVGPRERHQVAVPVSAAPERAHAELASQLQDHLAESTEAWGLPLPRCPRHAGTHPLDPRPTAARAAWWCPREGVRVRDIASTGHPPVRVDPV